MPKAWWAVGTGRSLEGYGWEGGIAGIATGSEKSGSEQRTAARAGVGFDRWHWRGRHSNILEIFGMFGEVVVFAQWPLRGRWIRGLATAERGSRDHELRNLPGKAVKGGAAISKGSWSCVSGGSGRGVRRWSGAGSLSPVRCGAGVRGRGWGFGKLNHDTPHPPAPGAPEFTSLLLRFLRPRKQAEPCGHAPRHTGAKRTQPVGCFLVGQRGLVTPSARTIRGIFWEAGDKLGRKSAGFVTYLSQGLFLTHCWRSSAALKILDIKGVRPPGLEPGTN
jgi:hypothetical protein